VLAEIDLVLNAFEDALDTVFVFHRTSWHLEVTCIILRTNLRKMTYVPDLFWSVLRLENT